MKIQLNGEVVNFPSSLSEITLQQRIDFQDQHGDTLLEMYASIMAIDDEVERELELLQYAFEKMFRSFSFFSGVPVEVLKESEFIDQVAAIYHATLKQILEDEAQIEFTKDHVWNSEEWTIAPPELKHGDHMKFGELIDAKQVVQDLQNIGKGKWHSLLPLCAVYFRKKGEEYHKSFLYEDSERLELMKTLPLDKALVVGFFLSTTMTSFISTLVSSNQADQSLVDHTARSTLKDSGGSTS